MQIKLLKPSALLVGQPGECQRQDLAEVFFRAGSSRAALWCLGVLLLGGAGTAAAESTDDAIDKEIFANMETAYQPEVGQDAVRAIQDVISLYFPAGRPNPAEGSAQQGGHGGSVVPRVSSPLESN